MADNNDQKKTVTTRGIRCYNSDQKYPVSLEWGFMDEMLKISFAPALPESERTEKKVYDYNNSWITCISRPKCIGLLKGIEEKIIPAIKNKEEKFVGVEIADVNMFGVGTRIVGDRIVPFASLMKNIDDTLKTSRIIEYEFRQSFIINDYNPSTGEYSGKDFVEAEFEMFLGDLRQYIATMGHADAQSYRVVETYFKDILMADIRAIGKKVGAMVSEPGGFQKNGARTGQASLFNSNAKKAPIEQISTLDDITSEFDGLDVPF